ncbi:MAG TPA: hypothetical protein VH374_09175 [Polyangia bacterium]|nr:hypothetical protein [Polyangia bacterium]
MAATFGFPALATRALAAPIKVVTPGEQNTQSTEATWPLYPKLMQTALGAGYSVLNNGDISGSVLSSYTGQPMGVHPFATPGQPTYDTSINPPPDIVIIGPFGEHDLRVVLVAQWKSLATVTAFAKDYDSLVTDYTRLSSKPRVFVTTPIVLPNFNPPDTMNFVKGVVLPAVQQVAAARSLPVIDLYTEFSNNLATYMGTDGQVNAKGQVKISDMIVAAIKADTGADGGTDAIDAAASNDAHDAASSMDTATLDVGSATGTGGAGGSAGTGGAAGGGSGGSSGTTGSGGSTKGNTGSGGASAGGSGGQSTSSGGGSSGCAFVGASGRDGGRSKWPAWLLLSFGIVSLRRRRR